MKARKYDRRIGIYKATLSADGFGGSTITESYIGESWCNITTASNNPKRLVDLGITEPKDAIIVKMRHRNDIALDSISYYLVYNGYKYVIQSLTNIDLKNVDMELICVQKGTTTT